MKNNRVPSAIDFGKVVQAPRQKSPIANITGQEVQEMHGRRREARVLLFKRACPILNGRTIFPPPFLTIHLHMSDYRYHVRANGNVIGAVPSAPINPCCHEGFNSLEAAVAFLNQHFFTDGGK